MKNLAQILSPSGWLFVYAGTLMPVYIIFSPTLKEFIAMYLVDLLAYVIYSKLFDQKLIEKISPYTRFLYKTIAWSELEKLDENQKIHFYEQLTAIPLKRAIGCYVVSFIKAIPAFMVIVFYWHHSISHWEQLIRAFLMTMVTWCYFYGAVYIESHIFLSQLIGELHIRFDWSDVFIKAKIKNQSREFLIQEALTLLFIIFFMLGLQMTLLWQNNSSSIRVVSIQIFALGLIGISLFFRIWYLGRKFFTGGLNQLFRTLENFEPGVSFKPLSLHTTGLLAHFEKTFNNLVFRLRNSEFDLYELVFSQAETSRYQALGEISAIIAHDMTGPLSAAKYYVTRLQSGDAKEKTDIYLEHLEENINQSLDLVTSLRARLKNNEQKENMVSFDECYQHVHKLLKTQFYTEGFVRIKFFVDSDLKNSFIKLPRVDFIHILDNLLRNSIKNLIENKIVEASIHLNLVEFAANDRIVFEIKDNGTGLDQKDFQQLVSGYQGFNNEKMLKNSLGLKLTKRLIEFHHGSIFVNTDNISKKGTTFTLGLPGKRLRSTHDNAN